MSYISKKLQNYSDIYGGNNIGAILIIISSFTMAAMMAAIKELSLIYPSWQILLARSAGQLIILVPIIISSKLRVFRTKEPLKHTVRIILAYLGLIAWFYAIGKIPLADASAIWFSRAIFLVILGGIIFKERVGFIGWFAAIFGLFGVILMLNPNSNGINIAALAAVFGAICTGFVAVIIKKLTVNESTATIMSYSALGLTLLCVIPSLFIWVPITLASIPLFLITISCGAASQWFFINAYRHGEASVMSTIEYSRLVAAAFLGYVLFTETPTLISIIGISIIIISSFIAVQRDRIRNRFLK